MRFSVILFIIIAFYFNSYSQEKEDLVKKKQDNYNNIKFTNELLEKNKAKKKTSYNRLLLLNSKIKNRTEIISNINEELDLIDSRISVHQDIILNLQMDLDKLKDEYAKMIYYSFLHRSSYDKLMFILAADDVNMGFRRLKYLQQYSTHRKNQVLLIQETKNQISEEIIQFEIIKADKKDLILNKQIENQNLLSEKQEQNVSLKGLKSKEKELKIQLNKQYKIAQNLQKEIERIIEEEARIAAEKARNSSPDFFKLTPEEQLIADNINKNKTHLPWPTQRGVITSNFGEHPHPVIKGVKVRNDGVDIATNEGAVVRSIFEGTVSRVFVLPGAHKTIIIRHGNYLTVYSNLKDVIVKQGDKISTKQSIGVVYTDKDNENKTVLQFQIWKENIKLNPEEWLTKGKNG